MAMGVNSDSRVLTEVIEDGYGSKNSDSRVLTEVIEDGYGSTSGEEESGTPEEDDEEDDEARTPEEDDEEDDEARTPEEDDEARTPQEDDEAHSDAAAPELEETEGGQKEYYQSSLSSVSAKSIAEESNADFAILGEEFPLTGTPQGSVRKYYFLCIYCAKIFRCLRPAFELHL